MSDYLSTLAARSLRREPACEPRRAQMFEPRQEASGMTFTEEPHEGLHVEETHAAVAPQTQVAPPRAGGDGPDTQASPRHILRPAEAAREASHPIAARPAETHQASNEPVSPPISDAAGERPAPRVPRDVTVVAHTPSAHGDAALDKPERVATPVSDSEAAPTRAPRADMFDEGDGERTSAVAGRAARIEPLAERVETKGPAALIETEFIPRLRASQRAESQTRSEPESLSVEVLRPHGTPAAADVRPVSAQPSAPKARAVLSAQGDFAVPTAAREASAQTQQPPTIEVTIGRIEVRAVTPPAPPAPPQRQRQAPPKMSLDEYLRAQGGGRS